jgi:hypothetical protein
LWDTGQQTFRCQTWTRIAGAGWFSGLAEEKNDPLSKAKKKIISFNRLNKIDEDFFGMRMAA